MKDLYNLKVAKVLSDNSVVINAGSEDGVDIGMRFVIYSFGEEIIDPDGGVSLGRLESTKGTVTVYHVQDKFCTAITGTRKVPIRPGSTITKPERMLLLDVQVGDHVKRVG